MTIIEEQAKAVKDSMFAETMAGELFSPFFLGFLNRTLSRLLLSFWDRTCRPISDHATTLIGLSRRKSVLRPYTEGSCG